MQNVQTVSSLVEGRSAGRLVAQMSYVLNTGEVSSIKALALRQALQPTNYGVMLISICRVLHWKVVIIYYIDFSIFTGSLRLLK